MSVFEKNKIYKSNKTGFLYMIDEKKAGFVIYRVMPFYIFGKEEGKNTEEMVEKQFRTLGCYDGDIQ